MHVDQILGLDSFSSDSVHSLPYITKAVKPHNDGLPFEQELAVQCLEGCKPVLVDYDTVSRSGNLACLLVRGDERIYDFAKHRKLLLELVVGRVLGKIFYQQFSHVNVLVEGLEFALVKIQRCFELS